MWTNLSFCACDSECLTVGHDIDKNFQIVTVNQDQLSFKRAAHQLFHALGRYHEHQREDRDEYVQVLWENVKEGNNFLLNRIQALIEHTVEPHFNGHHWDL